MKNICFKITKFIWLTLATVIILVAVLFGGLRAATPYFEKYKSTFVDKVNQAIPYSISIDNFSIAWYRFSPVISLNEVVIYSDKSQSKQLLTIGNAYIGMSLTHLIKTHEIIPNRIIVNQANLTLPTEVIKQIREKHDSDDSSSSNTQAILKAFATIDELALKNLTVKITDPKRKTQVIIGNILINRDSDTFRTQGDIYDNATGFNLHLVSSLSFDKQTILPKKLKGYFEVNNFNSERASHYFSFNFPVSGIVPQGRFWIKYQDNKLEYLATNVTARNIKFSSDAISTKQAMPYLYLSAIYSAQDKDKKIYINNFSTLPDEQQVSGLVSLFPDTMNLYLQNVRANSKKFLDNFTIENKELKKFLSKAEPTVLVTNLRAKLNYHEHKLTDYHAQMSFNQLSSKVYDKLPELNNVSGDVDFQNAKGEAVLQLNQSVVNMPWLFRKPVTINNGQFYTHWSKQNERWRLMVDNAQLTMKQGSINPSMSLFIGGDRPARLEILADAKITSLTQQDVYRYLPVGIINDPVTEWLDQAILQVGESSAKLILRGDIAKFPFDQNQGLFLISAKTKDSDLHFYKDWPIISGISADLLFKNRLMDIKASKGVTQGMNISHGRAVIPSMGDPKGTTLEVKASGSGSAANGVSYLINSPLASDIEAVKDLKTKGSFDANLDITVPFTDGQEVVAKGIVNIKDTQLKYGAMPVGLNHIDGKLNFKNSLITADKVKAYLGDKPVFLSVGPYIQGKSKSTKVNLSGSFSINELNKYLPQKIPSFISGAAIMIGSIIFEQKNGFTIALQSDLNGIKVNLPEPLGKPADKSAPLTVLINDVSETSKQIVATYQNILRTNIYLNHDENNNISLQKGTINIGSYVKKPMPSEGINIIIKLPSIDVKSWLSWYDDNTTEAGSSDIQGLINSISLYVKNFSIFDQSLSDLFVEYKPYTNYYIWNINSNKIAGVLNIPKQISSANPISINLKKLYYQSESKKSKSSNEKAWSNQYANFLNIDFKLNDFRFNQMRFGSVSGKMRTVSGQSLTINPLSSSSANYKLNSSVSWNARSNRSQFTGVLKSTNTQSFLTDLKLSGRLASQDANLDFNLSWNGFPADFNLPSLNGTANLSVNKGKIVGLSKSTNAKVGLGTIITALNIESLPGRLSQGLGEKNEGFGFKTMKGDFNIKSGNLLTQRAFIDSPVAYVSMKGRIGLAAEDLDLMVTIIPHLTSSLPVIATIAGGPVAGVATWVVDKAIGSQVDKISQYKYSVTGSWNNPVVRKQ